jgi:GT2 family glycosyltransferase
MTVDGAQALAARGDAPWPTVTVGILAFNRRDAVRTTLTKIGELDYPPDALEVIVVDNASADGTSEMVHSEFPDVRVIRIPENVGVSGCNRVFPVGAGQWFLMLDDDAYVEGGDLKRAVAAAEANAADLVSFRVRSSFEPDYLFNDEYVTGLLSFWGAAWMISRRAVTRVGGFDPYIFLWGNEAELTARVLQEGFRHLFLPEVVATHLKRPSRPTGFVERSHELNYRHWAYIAGKLLRPAHAARVLGRLVITVLIDGVALSPRALGTLPKVLAGFADGLRARRPLRPELSVLYRDAFASFANPLHRVRGPVERLATRAGRQKGDGAAAARVRRRFERHAEVFPAGGPTVLER